MRLTAEAIVTKRLNLIPLTLADLPAIFQIAREKASIEDFQYVAETVDDVRAWLEPGYRDPDTLIWTIYQSDWVIGLIELCLKAEYSDWQANVCRVGYFLDYHEHNQGFATEALLAIVEWVFTQTEIERIEAGVTLSNIASYRVLEKVGFTREKVVKDNWEWHGKRYDSAYYCLLKSKR